MDLMTYSTKYINFEKIHHCFWGDAENLIFFFGMRENFKCSMQKSSQKQKKSKCPRKQNSSQTPITGKVQAPRCDFFNYKYKNTDKNKGTTPGKRILL